MQSRDSSAKLYKIVSAPVSLHVLLRSNAELTAPQTHSQVTTHKLRLRSNAELGSFLLHARSYSLALRSLAVCLFSVPILRLDTFDDGLAGTAFHLER